MIQNPGVLSTSSSTEERSTYWKREYCSSKGWSLSGSTNTITIDVSSDPFDLFDYGCYEIVIYASTSSFVPSFSYINVGINSTVSDISLYSGETTISDCRRIRSTWTSSVLPSYSALTNGELWFDTYIQSSTPMCRPEMGRELPRNFDMTVTTLTCTIDYGSTISDYTCWFLVLCR